ncbi:MAG: hypothetical protein FWC10_00425 [Lentimicrobiaceae bacterium]|nr:hypothetical protein [Lentimicrobiaceae bacterium]
MKPTTWYDTFLEIIKKKYPKKAQLTDVLTELLSLEREATYRRLRKEVFFSAQEIVTIASAWNISLDEIMGVNTGIIPFQMKDMNDSNALKEETNFLQSVTQSIAHVNDFSTAEFMDVCNRLPYQLLADYEYLSKFYYFKWVYQYNCVDGANPFSKVDIPDDTQKFAKEYHRVAKQVANSSFIFDAKIFEYLIHDVEYFCSIYLITKEEKELVKRDILRLLNYLHEIANTGCYPETQNKVSLFISELNVPVSYSYVYTPEINVCNVHVFENNKIYSFHSEMVENFITWMQQKKKTSIQISEVDEKSRIDFFAVQRELLNNF